MLLIISFDALAKATASESFLIEKLPGVDSGCKEMIFFSGVPVLLKKSATSVNALPVILNTTANSSPLDFIPTVVGFISV